MEIYRYDKNGNVTNLVDSSAGVSPVSYSYNAANRLLSAVSATETNSYTYDAAGRLISQTVNGQSRSYAYSFGSQMVSLTDTNGTTFTYDFDADGNRTKQSQAGCLSARYVYDGPNVVLDLNASNEVVHAYVNGLGIDQPIERIAFAGGSPLSTLNSRLVYHTDGLGSVVALTDSGQQIAKSYSYEAFGKIRSETGNPLTVNRYAYTARESLGDSLGLYYYRWRVMDPNVGRFTSEDPLRFVDGVNVYVYVRNGPISFYDPYGLYPLYDPLPSGECPEGQTWVPNWQAAGYSSAWNCANNIWNDANSQVPPPVWIGAGVIGIIYLPVGVGVVAGQALNYYVALEWCKDGSCLCL